MNYNKEGLIVLAKMARKAKRYDDMAPAMNEVVQAGEPLTQYELSLLYVAFNRVVDERLASWRTISSILRDSSASKVKRYVTKKYQVKIESELKDICLSVQKPLDELLISGVNSQKDAESHVFLLNMKSEMYRVLVEISTGDDRDMFVELAAMQYESSKRIVEKWMPPTHPHRLRLHVTHSLFKYDFEDKREEARYMAKAAFDTARAMFDSDLGDLHDEVDFFLKWLKETIDRWEGHDNERNKNYSIIN